MLSSSCTSLGNRSLELASPLRLSDTIKTSGHLPVRTKRLQETTHTHTTSFPVCFLLRLVMKIHRGVSPEDVMQASGLSVELVWKILRGHKLTREMVSEI